MKKRSIFLLLFCFCIILFNFTVYAAKITGKAVNTDIVAYVNGLPIKSYNIDGKTAIIAEDLKQYGFRVNYFDEYRLLQIEYVEGDNTEITASYTPEQNRKPIGSFLANIYETDIIVKINNTEVPSYNIGGQTLIFIDSLEIYGDVVWDSEERKVYFTYVPNWTLKVPEDNESDTSANISEFTLELIRDETGEFIITGKNRQYITYVSLSGGKGDTVFQFSLYQNVNLQTEELSRLLNQMLNTDKGEWITNDMDFANEHMKIVINGDPVSIIKIDGGGGNGHSDYRFTLNKEFRTVEEIQSIQIECK